MSPPGAFEVRQALDRIRLRGQLPNGEFRLLLHLCEETLAGRGEELSQKVLACDVFGRRLEEFDPRKDSIVRTTAANLRGSLLAYYGGPGRGDLTVIELPSGNYVPRFSCRARLSEAATARLWSARVALESRTVSGYAKAHSHLDAVLAENPTLSSALALKAEAFASQAIHGSRPRPCLMEAQALVNRALESEQPAWQAHLIHGAVRWALHLDWKGAAAGYERALRVSDGESATHVWFTAFLVGVGRPREAVAYLQRMADRFGYCNPTYLGDLAMLHMLSCDFASARTTILGALDAAPHYYQHHLNHAILLEAEGDPGGALRALDRTPLQWRERPVTWGLRALFAGLSGKQPVARRRIQWISTLERLGAYVPPSQLAVCYVGMGDAETAVAQLERSREDRDPLMVWFYAYPFFRHLRGHPRFERLIDSIGTVRF